MTLLFRRPRKPPSPIRCVERLNPCDCGFNYGLLRRSMLLNLWIPEKWENGEKNAKSCPILGEMLLTTFFLHFGITIASSQSSCGKAEAKARGTSSETQCSGSLAASEGAMSESGGPQRLGVCRLSGCLSAPGIKAGWCPWNYANRPFVRLAPRNRLRYYLFIYLFIFLRSVGEKYARNSETLRTTVVWRPTMECICICRHLATIYRNAVAGYATLKPPKYECNGFRVYFLLMRERPIWMHAGNLETTNDRKYLKTVYFPEILKCLNNTGNMPEGYSDHNFVCVIVRVHSISEISSMVGS